MGDVGGVLLDPVNDEMKRQKIFFLEKIFTY